MKKIIASINLNIDFSLVGSASKYRSVKAELLDKTMVLRIDTNAALTYTLYEVIVSSND